jgi:protein-S-isoprenylcysteine O-methyltransferase Ste14
MNRDLLLYAAHAVFWASFGVTRMLLPKRSEADAPATSSTAEAPYSRLVLGVHFVAFLVLYMGIGAAVIPGRVPQRFPHQRITGAVVILIGAALASWAIASFHSWRFRAKLDAGHQLATDGAFALLRHPIYAAINLLALGSALWAETIVTWIGFALIVIGSEVRARSEESLLRRVFGDAYVEYMRRTKRFVPWLY